MTKTKRNANEVAAAETTIGDVRTLIRMLASDDSDRRYAIHRLLAIETSGLVDVAELLAEVQNTIG